MSVVNCIECNEYVDTDYDDFDFETGMCMECYEHAHRCDTCPFVGSERCECGCYLLKGIER
jgi:hypothetical protein